MTATVDVDEVIQARIQQRQAMGTVNVMLGDEQVFSGEVVAAQAVEAGGMFKQFVDWVSLMFSDAMAE